MTGDAPNPAVEAAERAKEKMLDCLKSGASFVLEAGAGAGKTYSLVEALRFLVDRDGRQLARRHQRIACITFTNVAKDEIVARTDGSPLIFCETTHAFSWALISGFQKALRDGVRVLPAWSERLEAAGGVDGLKIGYSLGHRSIEDGVLTLHHDDILPLTIKLLEGRKFRDVLSDKFPFILIDEYQDTNGDWIEAIKKHYLGTKHSPQFGFFGDHWQKIYGDGCSSIEHDSLVRIGKQANFRSVKVIVDVLNEMRPELKQVVKDPAAAGKVRFFHTNGWVGKRRTGQHWAGDLPAELAQSALAVVQAKLADDGWDFSPDVTKVLMLTHRALASNMGYASLPTVFQYNDSFSKKSDKHIAYFVDRIEPAFKAYERRRYGEMFAALDTKIPQITGGGEKSAWSESMARLAELRRSGTVADVIKHLRAAERPRLPDDVVRLEDLLTAFDLNGPEEKSRRLSELEKLHAVKYQEIINLADYLQGHSPFETKHGVKGAEFENVLVVVGRGWGDYNFDELLQLAANPGRIAGRLDAYERNRNLFYVACSRPKKRLAVLFTQQLSPDALATVGRWFGQQVVTPIVP